MMGGYYGPMMGGYGYGFGGILMGLFWLLILVGVVLLVVWLARGGTHPSAHPGTHPSMPGPMAPPTPPAHDEAMQIARKRLASGEITQEQFEELRKSLGG